MTFLRKMIALLKRYGLPLGIIFASLVVLQWILACNMRSVRNHVLDARYARQQRKTVGGGAPTGPAPEYHTAVQNAKRANSGALRRARKGKPGAAKGKDIEFYSP